MELTLNNLTIEARDLSDSEWSHLQAGSGVPLVLVQEQTASGFSPLHELIAEHCELHLVASRNSTNSTLPGLGDLIHGLGLGPCAVMGGARLAVACLDLALERPDTVSRLVLAAPELIPSSTYSNIDVPVLVLESSDVSLHGVGQGLSVVLPQCYPVLVHQASDMAISRPEAMAEIIIDFVERGVGFLISKPQGVIFP